MAVKLSVHYPTKGRSIVLRTDADWEKDVEPVKVSDDGDHAEFVVNCAEAWFETKVCLREADGTPRWSLGGNVVVSAQMSSARDLYPCFVGGGAGRISETIEVPGAFDCKTHRVRVYVPPGYDENTYRRYPVVYMHDGTNLFFPEESFAGSTWKVQGTLDTLDALQAIEPVIVVGIEAVDREEEYTARGWERYGRYIVETLKPLADTKGRTLPDPENTIVMGSSLGGLVSLYLAWRWPKVFGGAACLSGTFGLDDEIFKTVAREKRPELRVYLDSGYPRDNYESTLAMRDLLLRRGFRWGADLLHFVHPGARHNESDWALRLHLPMQFFFSRGASYA